jgi:very-short-patch-repair endonuclease
MWCWLRNRRFARFKFRRQVPIGHYIVDFYCAELKIVVELDGAHHRLPGMDEYDDQRTSYLRQRGLRVLRIPNEMLVRDSESVVEMIQGAIEDWPRSRENSPPHPPSAPSPPLKGAGEKDSRLEESWDK